MKKRIIALSITTAVALVLIVGLAPASLEDAPYIYPVGTIIPCCCEGTGEFVGYGFVDANGYVHCKWWGGSDPTDPIARADIRVAAFSNTQTNPELGTITWTLDASREVAGSITANQAGAPFPATAHVGWHANVQVGERSYRTVNPVEFQATLTHWPSAGTQFTQVGEVTLERVDDPAAPTQIVRGLSVTIISNNDPCP